MCNQISPCRGTGSAGRGLFSSSMRLKPLPSASGRTQATRISRGPSKRRVPAPGKEVSHKTLLPQSGTESRFSTTVSCLLVEMPAYVRPCSESPEPCARHPASLTRPLTRQRPWPGQPLRASRPVRASPGEQDPPLPHPGSGCRLPATAERTLHAKRARLRPRCLGETSFLKRPFTASSGKDAELLCTNSKKGPESSGGLAGGGRQAREIPFV